MTEEEYAQMLSQIDEIHLDDIDTKVLSLEEYDELWLKENQENDEI
jgi:hypothetical protein